MDTLKKRIHSTLALEHSPSISVDLVTWFLIPFLFILLDSAVNKVFKIVMLKKKLFIFQINFKIKCEILDYSNKVNINTDNVKVVIEVMEVSKWREVKGCKIY